jgi:type VII secretion-associated serine protease mycosin
VSRTPAVAALHRAAALLLAALVSVLALGDGTAHAAGEGIRAKQWGLQTVHAPDAWQTTKGAGIIVAVLDTGVDATHPDLAGSVMPGKDLVGFGATRGEETWARHGTAMAGIIAGHGHGPDSRDGVMGVAPEAKILPVRVLLEEDDPERDKARRARGGALADGIRWAADHGADVINLSLGDDSDSAHPDAAQDAAVRYALGKGVVVVASAGNDGEDGDHVSYPAAYPGVIAVTAVDRDGKRAAFSTRHWYATLSAPGKDVIITEPDRHYYKGWGTSAAAAFVSGAAALIRSAYPELKPAQIKKLLAETASDTPAGGRSDALGTGVVDPAAALETGANLQPHTLHAAALPYKKEYFGGGPSAAEDGTGWLVPLCSVGGLLLVAAAFALHRGRLNLPGGLRRPGRGTGAPADTLGPWH